MGKHIWFIKSALDLLPFSDKKTQNLSGGNKRKLCSALSLIGCPTMEFMDEPTTGVDPISRKSLLNVLSNLEYTSMFLTTHRMDEAEALCDKIAIMINGQFACYGSPDELKSEFAQGYKIVMYHIIE